ncbi:trimeric intracellular cation channel family protein [Paraburkholderia sp. USG1]|uniref:trimeric intracellular cation channel family protein n=1 Tax=Paraburkholderia sp. USG1 TaxID=2952268 RepID=UPI002862FC45|nr:trimeric intracellular cation channel family protein [Paraburkholderia sp. USG1]MDR8396565.1 trimeric intracellular cation channel family protein [Paraburkholderia sp. USG1]
MNSHAVSFALDLIGTFAFAISGAVAARQKRLDLFGILSIAFMVACGGGIVRDVCIGAIPPAGLSNWRYLAASVLASAVAIFAYAPVRRLRQPVLFFDAIGLGLFAVAGAQKALSFGHGAELAVLMGIVTAVGGGVMRDVVLSRLPAILDREIYATAALTGAGAQILFSYAHWTQWWTPWFATFLCVAIRLASLRFGWRLPAFRATRASSLRDDE